MYYIFEKNGKRRQLRCSMAEIPAKGLLLEERGWKRVWTVPGQIVIPTYWEAMEESEDMMLEAERGEGPMVSHIEPNFSPEELKAELRQYA